MATGLDKLQQTFASNPDDRRSFESLEEHYFLEGDWESLVGLYRDRLVAPSIESDDQLRAPLLFRLGQILEERILDLHHAAEAYWTLAKIDPQNRPALRQLRGIHERRGQWDMVLQISELESATNMPPYERAAFETELGLTWKEHLSDPEEARRAFERALESDAEFPAALEGLATLHREAGRMAEAAEILERLTVRLRGPERAPVWIALGGLYAGSLERPDRARVCFSAAMEDDPFQTPAVEWSLLLATAAEDWPAVSELLENRFDLASGARHRAAVAVEASQIQLNHLNSAASARAWVDRALELAAEEPAVLLAASAVERSDGDREALLGYLDTLVRVLEDRTPRAVLVEIAELQADFGRQQEFLATIERLQARAETADEQILRLQARVLRESGAKSELAEVLETLSTLDANKSRGERAALLCELALIQEQDLSDDDAAESNWSRALELEPENQDTLAALERLYRKHEDWSALRNVLETTIQAVGDPVPPVLPTRLGQLLIDQFDDASAARRHFESALSVEPGFNEAIIGLRQVAERTNDPELMLELCENEANQGPEASRLAQLTQTVLPILEERGATEDALRWATRWTESQPESIEALCERARIESTLGDTDAEVVTREKLAALQTGGDRAESLVRIAEIQTDAGDPTLALQALEAARESDPKRLDVQRSLCDHYRESGLTEELSRSLRALANASPQAEQAAPLEELAHLLEDTTGDLDAAIAIRWRLIALPDAPVQAFSRLEVLLERAGRYAELVQLLEARRTDLHEESPEAFDLDLRRAGLLLESLGQPEQAAEILTALHAQDPTNEASTERLEQALRNSRNAAGLCDFLAHRADDEQNPERRRALRFERATLLEEDLNDKQTACDLFGELVSENVQDEVADRANERFENLLETTGQWERLREHLVGRVETLAREDQPSHRERIAALCRERLSDIAGCAEQLEIVAEIATDRPHVWQQLEEIYSQTLDQPSDWLRVVDAELAGQCDPRRELRLRVTAAALLRDETRRPEGRTSTEAFAHYERILELEPGHKESTEALADHYTDTGRPRDAADLLVQRLESLGSTRAASVTELRLRLAQLLAGPLESDDEARPYFEAVREELGAVAQVAYPLADLYERADAFEALSGLSQEAILAESDAHAVLTWRLRLARSERALGRLEEAAVAYRAVLAETPRDREIEDALIDIYSELSEAEPLCALLEERLEDTASGSDDAIALHLRLAGLYADHLSEARTALRHLESVLDSNATHATAIDLALTLAEQVEDPEQLVRILDRALETTLPTDERAALLERRGRLFADRLDNREQAILSLRESLRCDANRASARQALREQFEALEQWPSVLDCRLQEALAASGDARIQHFEEAAELARLRIGPDASLPWLTRIAEERPEDPALPARIAEIHRRAGRHEASLRALDQQLQLESDNEELCSIHLRRAHLFETELDAPARAIHAFEAVRGLRGDEPGVLKELDRLLCATGRPHDRVEILETQLAVADSGAEATLREDLATILATDLGRPDLALPHLEANVASSQSNPQREMNALGKLDHALRASARHDAWIPVAERQIALLEEHPEIATTAPVGLEHALRQDLADQYDTLMGDTDRALHQLKRLVNDSSEGDPVLSERIRSLLRRTGRWSELASELRVHVTSQEGRPEDWMELARLREERLLDLAGARDAYSEASASADLRLDALRGKRRCSERLRDWNACADSLEEEYALEDQLQVNERTALARRLGDLASRHLADRDRAARAYRMALDLDSEDLGALRALTQVKETAGEISETVELYRRELDLLEAEGNDRPRQKSVWLRLAELLGRDPETRSESIDAYQSASAIERLTPADELTWARLFEAADRRTEFCETFARWCDRDESPARIEDHLELAQALLDQNDSAAARARAERATAVAPESPEAWALLAQLVTQDEPQRAAEAYERAADHATAPHSAEYLVRAASVLEDRDIDRAHQALERARSLDAAGLEVHVALSRVASRLGHLEQCEREAELALEIACAPEHREALAPNERLEVALLGGRAARTRGSRDASRRLFEAVLEIDPDQVEALEGVAFAHFEAGDFAAACAPLERRLALPEEDINRARHLAMVARGLEADGHYDRAWSRFEEALESDRVLEEAHEGVVRLHERAGRPEEALVALERWSDSSTNVKTRAMAAFRAAEHALSLNDKDRALSDLEIATEADRSLAPAWMLRCDLAAELGSDADTRDLCSRALGAIEPGPLSARISLRAARLAEIAGDTEEARERYREASRFDARSSEAVLCESRLARMEGDWAGAEAVLSQFIDHHPDTESPTLAHVHLERGRLLSGPLEKPDFAIGAYEAALRLDPELAVARSSLASLLVHAPERWREALDLHRSILSNQPTNAQSLRALHQLAEQRNQTDLASGVLAVLRSLGLASPSEADQTEGPFRFAIHPGPPMAETQAERLRRLAHQVSQELTAVLQGSVQPRPTSSDAELDATIEQILAIEDEISAPGLGRLPADERAQLFSTLAALFLDPGGNGAASHFQEPLDAALGRWTRRKARRIVEETTLAEIEDTDHVAWGFELRAMAAAQVIDRTGGDLRSVLRALLVLDPDCTDQPTFSGSEIGTLISNSEAARRLMARVTTLLCDRIERS